MKRYLSLFFFLFFIPIVLGMGSFDSTLSPDKVPMPEKNYEVTFIDQMDISVTCQNASIEGKAFIEGKIGNGNHVIDFDKIKYILFHFKGGKLIALVKLSNNNTVEFEIKKNLNAFGMTKYGTFHIKLIDLKKMLIEKSG